MRFTFVMIRRMWLPPWGMLLCVLATGWLTAQEPPVVDPFGDVREAPRPAPVAADTKKKEAPGAEEQDPIVLGIRASRPNTPQGLMQAVVDLTNYGRPDEAKRYLSVLNQNKLDDATSWQLQRKFGSAIFFRLSNQPDLQPDGGQLADTVLRGASQYPREATRLEALIKQLSAAQPEQRHAALVDLKEAGSDAVLAILQVLGDSSRAADHPILRTALVQLGSLSVLPMLATLDSPDEALRWQAMTVLGRLRVVEAVPLLLRPYFAAAPGSAEGLAAKAALSQLTKELPTQDSAERQLIRLATEYFDGRLPRTPDHENRIEWWQWDPASQRPVRRSLDTITAPPMFAARLARDLVALAPANQEYRRLHLAAELESAKLAGGWEQPLKQGAGTAFEMAASHRFSWDDVLQFAMDRGHPAAAVGILEVMAAAGDASDVRSTGGRPRVAVLALRNPSRRVQFAAAQAVMRLDPREPYAGASYLTETLGYFARTSGLRRVLIAHPRIEVSHNLAGMFREVGIESELTTSGSAGLHVAQRTSDFEFALLSDALDRPSVQELVGQFRREPRTARLPIGILARPELADRLRRTLREDPLTEVFTQPADAAGVTFVIRRLLERVDQDWVPYEQRMSQAAAALDHLARLAENPEIYSFYELLPQQSALELAVTVPELSTKAARVLGLVATTQAQQTLVQIANQTGRNLNERRAAAAAFEVAVKRRGLLLTRGEILQQYDLYNASAHADPGTQQVLGAILDTIEGPTAPASPAADSTP